MIRKAIEMKGAADEETGLSIHDEGQSSTTATLSQSVAKYTAYRPFFILITLKIDLRSSYQPIQRPN